MATHSSVPASRIPGTAEPGGLLSMGSHRVGHDWSDLAAGVKHNDSIFVCIANNHHNNSSCHPSPEFFFLWWDLVRFTLLTIFKYAI